MLKNPWRPTDIHHNTQKTIASTKPKINDRQRPTDSPQNPENQQHPPPKIQRQHYKTQNRTKSQPWSQPPSEIPEKKSNRISTIIHQIRPTTSIKSEQISAMIHDPSMRRRRENRWEERKKKKKEIYIYIYRERERERERSLGEMVRGRGRSLGEMVWRMRKWERREKRLGKETNTEEREKEVNKKW